jgi:hypothetical protein
MADVVFTLAGSKRSISVAMAEIRALLDNY